MAARAPLFSSARPPGRARERASERLHARAGPLGARSSRSPAAACCGSRRRDTGWACPGGRGALARAGPTQRRGAGFALAPAPQASLWARSSCSPGGESSTLAASAGPSSQICSASGSQPARSSAPPPPAVLSAATARPAETPLFRGAAPAGVGGGNCRGSAPWAPWVPGPTERPWPTSRHPAWSLLCRPGVSSQPTKGTVMRLRAVKFPSLLPSSEGRGLGT